MHYDLTSLRSYAIERPEYPQNVRERRTWLFLKRLRMGRGPAATRTLYRYRPDFHFNPPHMCYCEADAHYSRSLPLCAYCGEAVAEGYAGRTPVCMRCHCDAHGPHAGENCACGYW